MSLGHNTPAPFGGQSQDQWPASSNEQMKDFPIDGSASDLPIRRREDEMEGQAYQGRKTLGYTHALTPEQLRQVLEKDPGLYQRRFVETVEVDGVSQQVSHEMSDIFALNGNDVPNAVLDRVKKQGKIDTVVAFHNTKEMDDGQGGQSSVFDDGFLVGASLVPKDQGKGKKGKQSAGKTAPGPKTASAPKDCVKVSFHLDSQMPNLQVTTRKLGQASGSSDILSTRIWASDLALTSSGTVAMHIRPIGDQRITMTATGTGDREELQQMANNNKLFEMGFELRHPNTKRNWTGLRADEVEEIRNRKTEDSMKDGTQTRDLTVQNFEKSRYVCFYFGLNSDAEYQDFLSIANHFQRILTLARLQGNFWFYRLQLIQDKQYPRVLEDIAMPKINFKVPRWLVTRWQFTESSDGNTVTFSDPLPYSWVHHRTFESYPNANEAAFLLKLDIEGESARQSRDLREFSTQCYFRGSFMEVDEDPGRFFVEVFIADNSGFDQRSLKMPTIGSRINLELVEDPSSPFKQMVKYSGIVCEDIFTNGAAFCCYVKGYWPGTLNRLETHALFVSFAIDTTPHQRMLLSAQRIQTIPSSNKPTGVDIKALVFGDDAPAPSTNYVAGSTSAEDLEKFKIFVDTRKPVPNSEQKDAAMDTTTSSSGATGIQGPPGCGKTDLLQIIAHAHVHIGRKLMICAPQNEAVLNVFEAFDTAANAGKGAANLDPLEYVLFTGAYQKIADADKLKAKLVADDPSLTEEDAELIVGGANTLAEFARSDQAGHGIVPHHDWTFRAKLKLMGMMSPRSDSWALSSNMSSSKV